MTWGNNVVVAVVVIAGVCKEVAELLLVIRCHDVQTNYEKDYIQWVETWCWDFPLDPVPKYQLHGDCVA